MYLLYIFSRENNHREYLYNFSFSDSVGIFFQWQQTYTLMVDTQYLIIFTYVTSYYLYLFQTKEKIPKKLDFLILI